MAVLCDTVVVVVLVACDNLFAFHLISITDPKGQTFLHNYYDGRGRILRQRHGYGDFEFRYNDKEDKVSGISVEITRKNGSALTLKHDTFGHVIERTLLVSSKSLSSQSNG